MAGRAVASTGLDGGSGRARPLGVAVGLAGMGQFLLPLLARVVVEFAGPWSGTAALMVRSLALLVPAGLLWAGVRPRAALWAIGILGGWAAFGLPSTVQHVVDAASMSAEFVGLALVLLAVEVATVAVGALAARELRLQPVGAPSRAAWVAAAGAATFALSQLFTNVTVGLPADTPRSIPDISSSPSRELLTGPWTLTLAIVGTALVAAAAAVVVVRRWAPALAVPIALLPATIAGAINDTLVGPMQSETSAPEVGTSLAVGGRLNLVALLLLAATAVLAVRIHEDR